MDTKILTTTEQDLKIAADILKNGGNVIFPTETVYGLGADAKNPVAVNNIFKAKGRPSDNPLIVHISDIAQLKDIAKEIPPKAELLMDKFWPGPLTVILKKCKNVPYETTAGLDTVAVRMPASRVARRLIELSGVPIAAPSANLSGKPSPTTKEHCTQDMTGRVNAIVCGDDCEVGLESTVIDMSVDVPIVLRPGGVTAEQIKAVIGEIEVITSAKEGEKPKSPGLKYTHYSPNAEVVILSGKTDDVYKYISFQAKTKKVALLAFDEFPKIDAKVEVLSLGSMKNPYEAAHRLFYSLRKADEIGVDAVFAPEIPDKDMWSAVRNRLYRAAGERVLDLSGDKKKILFVCTGNTCRSPMAEGIFNALAADKKTKATADSAGIFADGGEASVNSVTVMKEIGIDINGRKSVQITQEMLKDADLIITMSKSHKDILVSAFDVTDKIKTLAEFAGENGDITDPFAADVVEYRKCRDLIYQMLEKAVDKL